MTRGGRAFEHIHQHRQILLAVAAGHEHFEVRPDDFKRRQRLSNAGGRVEDDAEVLVVQPHRNSRLEAPAHHAPGKVQATAAVAAADTDDAPAAWSVQATPVADKHG